MGLKFTTDATIPEYLKKFYAHIAIREYAAHSYLYYIKDTSIISDGDFDSICKFILENFDWIKPFDINDYIDRESMKAGTGFNIANKVCGQTKEYAEGLLKK